MKSTPLSIRFDNELLDRLRRRAAVHSTTPSSLVQRLVDEGLRAQDFPGIVFRDGPSGRRAGLAGGPDVWEVVRAVRDTASRGEGAISAAASALGLGEHRIRTALSYYGTYASEIDAELTDNERAAEDALRAWQAQQRLLA